MTPNRTQYAFDLSGVKCKTRADIINLQRAWETFEKTENYDDVVQQQLQKGYRGTLFYQFADRSQANDYRRGQELHVLRYPWLHPGTFASLRYSTFTTTPSMTGVPYISPMTPKICSATNDTITSSERLSQVTDMNTYIYVSTYNQQHAYKYIFTSDDDKMAYHRAERLLLSQTMR
ncbi:MAG: hypothetical protein EBU01_09190 [Crocinitomicaceae bacterium]|nr:hypothetical protein [Crocinitomicaceae bacterium]